MNSLLCPELANLIEKKINQRNKYTENPNFKKEILAYYDQEIDLLEKIETYIVSVKVQAQRVIEKERQKIFNYGRIDGWNDHANGRHYPLSFYLSENL